MGISAATMRGNEGQQNKLDIVCLVPIREIFFRFDVDGRDLEMVNDRSIGLVLLRLQVVILNSIVAYVFF